MKITRSGRTIAFSDVTIGQPFYTDGGYFIRLSESRAERLVGTYFKPLHVQVMRPTDQVEVVTVKAEVSLKMRIQSWIDRWKDSRIDNAIFEVRR